jgi:hypothetical protein
LKDSDDSLGFREIDKLIGLGYHKTDMCPNFYILYYLENAELIECKICGHAHYKSRTGREGLLSHIENLDTS